MDYKWVKLSKFGRLENFEVVNIFFYGLSENKQNWTTIILQLVTYLKVYTLSLCVMTVKVGWASQQLRKLSHVQYIIKLLVAILLSNQVFSVCAPVLCLCNHVFIRLCMHGSIRLYVRTQVLIECVFSAVLPTISAVERFVTFVDGSEGRLSCTATGDPFPLYTWTRNGIEISGMEDRFALESAGAVLVVRGVSVENEGAYQCHASNVVGRATDTVTLNVIGTHTHTHTHT